MGSQVVTGRSSVALVLANMSGLTLKETDGRRRAVEFFSGIGAFAQAAGDADVEVVAAFDQSQAANAAYKHNYGRMPVSRNLDSISEAEVPAADIWWMSPPCTPFSVRGRRRDDLDPRAASFINLINLAAVLKPRTIFIENVHGFAGSRVHDLLLAALGSQGYCLQEYQLCPTFFAVPMRRPRLFVVARLGLNPRAAVVAARQLMPLNGFLDPDPDRELMLDAALLERYGAGFDIVDPHRAGTYLTCFTSGYRRCMKASGSLVAMPDNRVRRVSPEEILRLLGFSKEFSFPPEISRPVRWRLVGNSVDVRAIRFLLGSAGMAPPGLGR